MGLSDITADAVRTAMREFDDLGREEFLARYGFGPARQFVLVYEGRRYDSKAIVGVAHKYAVGRALTADSFSGGARTVESLLRRLGFALAPYDQQHISLDDALERVSRLVTSTRYQPIMLLWAISRAHRGQERLLGWADTQREVSGLLTRYGTRPRPDYPIAALYRAGLWELRGHPGAVPTAHGDSELKAWFDAQQPQGGLNRPMYELMRESEEARIRVINILLDRFFADMDHRDVLRDFGLYEVDPDDEADDHFIVPATEHEVRDRYQQLCAIVERREDETADTRITRTTNDPFRSAAARRAVILRSDGRCENPGCAGQPDDLTDAGAPILDVDHIHDRALGGRDHPIQMIALCPNCHAIKTRGHSRQALRQILFDVARTNHEKLIAGQAP